MEPYRPYDDEDMTDVPGVPDWYCEFVARVSRTDQDFLQDGSCKWHGGWKPNHLEEEYLHMIAYHSEQIIMARLSVV